MTGKDILDQVPNKVDSVLIPEPTDAIDACLLMQGRVYEPPSQMVFHGDDDQIVLTINVTEIGVEIEGTLKECAEAFFRYLKFRLIDPYIKSMLSKGNVDHE